MDRIYFKLKDGRIVDDRSIVDCHYLVNNRDLNTDYHRIYGYDNRLDAIRVYAESLFGVECEIEPHMELIKDLVRNNRLIPAVQMYRDMHPGTSLMEAKHVIDKIRDEMIDIDTLIKKE